MNPARSIRPSAAPERLLVVEDDYLLATEAEFALRDAGYDVGEVVARGEDALNAAATTPFALAAIDIRLAGRMDGVDCARELFDRFGLRCIFVSASSDEETRRRAAPARPLGWLNKPYTMASLVDAVRDALDRAAETA